MGIVDYYKNQPEIKVLYIEDNEDHAEILLYQLKKFPFAKFKVHWVESLEKATSELENNAGNYQIILTDLKLKDSDEHNTIKKLQFLSSNIPIIALTSFDDPQLSFQLMDQGASDCLSKSFGKEDFFSKMVIRSIFYNLERMKYTNKLKDEKNAALKESGLKSNFVSNISHEIRTPLTAIIGMLDVIEQDLDKDTFEKYLNTCKSAGQHLYHLVNDVLDYSKIEANQIVLNNNPHKLQLIIDKCLEMFKFKAQERNIELKQVNEGENPSIIVVDKDRLSQILINLLSNAVKFTHKGSIQFNVKTFTDNICLSVKDTGSGMKKEDLPKIFDAFLQLKGKENNAIKGTGLGLAISSNLAKVMGGSLTVESELDIGTTFYLTLPIKDIEEFKNKKLTNEMTDKNYTTEEINEVCVGKKIMIAEDTIDNHILIKAILKKYQINFEIVMNGKEAVDLFIKNKGDFDLILMDMYMPELTGDKATTLIRDWERNNSPNKKIPIVAMTALGQKEELDHMFKCGCSDLLQKPFTRKNFLATLIKNLSE